MDVRKFVIRPRIPEKIIKLEELSQNLWSYWDKDAERLFHRLDPKLFRKLNHNPLELLYTIKPEKLEEAAKDKGFLYELKRVHEKYREYMEYVGSYRVGGKEKPFSDEDVVVYTCMEYGLHESLPFYSGGLAVLAGDHLKAASDVGIKMVSFGLLYKHGYFTQHVSADGTQIEEYKQPNWYLTPIKEVRDASGQPMLIEVPLKNDKILAKIWQIDVGKTILYLLDTNIHQNPERFRDITNKLYDANKIARIEQELILGRGCVIALKALNIKPKTYHMNEGHTAFMIVERLLDLTKNQGLSFEDAKNIIRCSTVFTTHTPVVEGNEHYTDELVKEYLDNEAKEIGLTINDFLSLGKIRQEKVFWLPAFAIRFSRLSNGVSKIHGEVSRGMWKNIFPTLHEQEIPIRSVTNGVHLQSWLSLQMTEMFDRYVGPDYFHRAEVAEVWENVYSIPDSEIWNAHIRRKEQIMAFIRRRISEMMSRGGYANNKIRDIEKVLDPSCLTIGFARRFAPYKRANLLMTDPDRLFSILTNKEKPVQLVFSGKAHPADEEGKKLIKEIYKFIEKYPVENHVVFIEDYDINVARHLVQGVDVWLNTPVKPMEASGTSGMKAGINGILNLSILDGWWPEAYDGENGWAILSREGIGNYDQSKKIEANNLYDLIENEVVKKYYDKREGGYSEGWVQMMKNSIVTTCSRFNMHRAVREYIYDYYLPQMEMYNKVSENDFEIFGKVKKVKQTLDAAWPKVYLRDYFTSINGTMPYSGDQIDIDCYVYMDDLTNDVLSAEALYVSGGDESSFETITLKYVEKYEDKVAKFTGSIKLEGSGAQEISVRIVPKDKDFRGLYPEYVKWKD